MKHSTTVVDQKKADIHRKSKRVLNKGKSSTEELPTTDNAAGDSQTGCPIKRARSGLQIGDQSGGAKLNDGPAAEVKETDVLVKKVVYGNRLLSAKITGGTPQPAIVGNPQGQDHSAEMNATGGDAKNKIFGNRYMKDKSPAGGLQPALFGKFARSAGGTPQPAIAGDSQVQEHAAEMNATGGDAKKKIFGNRYMKDKSPAGGLQPALFGKFARSVASGAVENRSQQTANLEDRQSKVHGNCSAMDVDLSQPSQFPFPSMTQESSFADCTSCQSLRTQMKRDKMYQIRADKEAATARQYLERLATENQHMLKTALEDLAASRKEVDRLTKLTAQLSTDNMHLKAVLREMKMSIDKAKF